MFKRTAEIKMSQIFPAVFGGFPIRLHVRTDLHLARKFWHASMGTLIASVYAFSGMSASWTVTVMACFLGADLLIETARLRIPTVNEKILKVWGPFMRAHEVNRMSTVAHFIGASILAVAIFPKPVALLSILFLAYGDPMASVIGILYGKYGRRFASGKSLIGTLAGVATCFMITFFYLKSQSQPDSTVLVLSLLGGAAGGMAELAPFEVDDNFTIPVVSGFVMWLAFMFFGV
ncbi:diacylglycerol/polyprenol kinase family protein [Bdellovibrionota bacterium FG-2]